MQELDWKGCVVHPDRMAGQVRTPLDPSLADPSSHAELFARSGHLATIACTLFKFDYDHIHYTRELIRVPDGGTIAVDIAPALEDGEDMDDRPILVVSQCVLRPFDEAQEADPFLPQRFDGRIARELRPQHPRRRDAAKGGGRAGLASSSRQLARLRKLARYLAATLQVRAALRPLRDAGLTFCSRSGAVTDDLRSALTFLSHFAPDAPLYGIGFSLGANQQAKFVGEEGADCPYNAAIVLGAPFDFWKGHIALSSTWLRSIYSRAMSSNLRRLVKRHEHVLKGDPRLDWDAIFSNPNSTLFEFDSLVTAPLSGFVRLLPLMLNIAR